MPNKLVLRLFEHNIWILILVDKRMLAHNCKLKIIKKFLFPKKFIFNTFEMNENFFWKKKHLSYFGQLQQHPVDGHNVHMLDSNT